MTKQLIVKAPLVGLKVSDGTRRHLYEGAAVPDDADKKHVQELVDLGMLGEDDAGSDSGSKEPTVDEILADVGDDKAKAAAALEAEQGRDKPRKSLVSKLEAIAKGD